MHSKNYLNGIMACCVILLLSFFFDSFISEDVVQEVFIKIWEDRKKIDIIGSVKSYLYSAVKNKSLNRIESESVRQKYSKQAFDIQSRVISQNELEQEEFRNHLFWCIDKLPPRCKEVFQNSRFEDLKQEQIAQNLKISIKTVKAQIGKALKLIRDCLQISYPEYL